MKAVNKYILMAMFLLICRREFIYLHFFKVILTENMVVKGFTSFFQNVRVNREGFHGSHVGGLKQ